jgi:hypothetical protein
MSPVKQAIWNWNFPLVIPARKKRRVPMQASKFSEARIVDADLRASGVAPFCGPNIGAQAYYERMGFRTNRVTETAVCKSWSSAAG